MKKTTIAITILALAGVVLSACGVVPSPTAASTQTTQSQANLSTRLAAGTLSLEGTPNAVTVEEAKKLLPLWKAVKNLASSQTISQAEINGLYEQIQETLTAEQVKAIQALSDEEIKMVMEKNGAQAPGGMAGETRPTPNSAQATQRAANSNQGQQPGGFVPGGAPPNMGGGGPGMPPGGQPQGSRSSSSGSSARATQAAGGGAPQVFTIVDAVIRLLEMKAKG